MGDSPIQPDESRHGSEPPETGDARKDSQEGALNGPQGLSENDRWEMLHDLLVGPEEARIQELEQVPRAPRAKDVGDVLAEATRRSAQEGPELAEALAPTIEQGLMSSARKNPDDLAEAIYPVLGPAIRRSIQATLSAAVETLNVTLENSFSPKGLRWRMQAWRTGRPFAEVVLLHSLAYRVEQVFWIHKETSVLLSDVSGVEDSLRDPELISGMLAAIQDFVQDSFAGADEGALEQIEVSGFRVLMAQGPKAVLAVLVRGIPPESLSQNMHETLESLHRSFADELQEFDGDVGRFERAIPDLQGLLGQGAKVSEPGGTKKGQWLIAAVALVAVLLFAVDWIQDRNMNSKRSAALMALQEAPGYSVQGQVGDGDHQTWTGFRDPLAEPWSEVCAHSTEELDVDIQWTPFVSLEPEMVQRRAEYMLQPPFGVTLTTEHGSLTLEGEASSGWVHRALARASAVPGIGRVDASGLVDIDRRAIETHARSLDGLTLPFGAGAGRLDRGQPVVQARLSALKTLDERVQEYGGGLLRLHLRATLGRMDDFERGLSDRRLVEVQKALGRLGLGATVVEVLPAPESDDSRSPLSGVRIEIDTLLPKP
ncbi:MAG: hypothetical protein P1V35_06690 [Planctomycetota bacterium]|nr:hypothetical protein [Planctomycetota bacterium]